MCAVFVGKGYPTEEVPIVFRFNPKEPEKK